MKSLFVPRRRVVESTRAMENLADQTFAAGGGYGIGAGGYDPVDGDRGFRPLGRGPRSVPFWTRERARTSSVTAYRMNPMARAIVDTYTAFCVGDSGLSLTCPVPEVRDYAERSWRDPRNQLHSQERQKLLLTDHLLMGETALELMTGALNGATRFSPLDTDRISEVTLDRGNPLWPDTLWLRNGGADPTPMAVMRADDITGRREGQVAWWVSFRALVRDRRGDPFLMPVLDDLDSYAQVVSNLIDRTALARHIAFDVEIDGDENDVRRFVEERGGYHMPRSGTIEVHNKSVKWTPVQATVGAQEDSTTAATILTSIAGGAGLAKPWLAESEGANRATSLSMAEPVRRRVGGVQAIWLEYQTDLVRYFVDQGVKAGMIPMMVESPRTGSGMTEVPAAMTVKVTGPEVAAADAQVTATILVNLATAITEMVNGGLLSEDAAKVLARKGWEQFAGVPYTSDLDDPEANVDDVATAVDDAQSTKKPPVTTTPVATLQGATP